MTVEEYIKDYTRNCSNEHCMTVQRAQDLIAIEPYYEPWLTPDHARAAAQIARDEVMDKTIEWIKHLYDHHYIIRYSDATETPLNRMIEEFRNYINEQ